MEGTTGNILNPQAQNTSECYCPEPEIKPNTNICRFCGGTRLIPVDLPPIEELKKEIKQEEKKVRAKKETLVIKGKQNTLSGEAINIMEFANLKEKREVKEKVKAMFNGEMFRSIIKAKDVDNNVRMDKLERQEHNGSTPESTIARATQFSKKTLATLSTFPLALTMVYTNLLSKKGDKVYDPFMGHNSRATAVLSMDREYYSYDIHSFPVLFTKNACSCFPSGMYDLNEGSSEKVKYADKTFDFCLTCPPYWDVEDYSKLYEEQKANDLSNVSYNDFLAMYGRILNETYRVLKSGAFCVIVIGDVHRGKDFYSLSNDTDAIMSKAGFIKHDENIYNRGSNIGGDLNYKNFILISKRLPTIHEYILIYRKP